MDDQRSLSMYYEGVLQTAALHLIDKHQGIEVQYPGPDKGDFPRSFQIRCQDQESNIEIILAIPYNFPDVFPTVIVPEPYFSMIYPIPHLDKRNVLCTFDPEVAHPNVNNPQGVLDEVIRKAFTLLKIGKSGENSLDYLDEFESYWLQESNSEILSLLSITPEPREISLLSFTHPNWGATKLVADERMEGRTWLVQAGATVDPTIKKAFYLPLTSMGLPPFPTTNGEFLKRIKVESGDAVKPLLEFLNKNVRPSTIVFSMPYKDDHIIGAWEHANAQQYKASPHKSKGKVQKGLKGFRHWKRNAFLELQRDFRDLGVKKQLVTRVDKMRLFSRGGDGESSLSQTIGIVGCGSIGSHIAKSLVELGINRLLLIDNDKLTFENVARHLCGANDVGNYKVHVVHQKLASHFPYLEVTTYKHDVLRVLRDYESVLNQCDFSIVALGHFPTEQRLNRLQKDGIINKPMLYVWVEPYLAGAHAVYVDPSNAGCFQCVFDEHHAFLNSVLAEPGEYSKREAGCQSTYVPYGIVEVKRFISDLMFFIEDIQSGKMKENVLFTWLGNLTQQKEKGRRIAGRWAVAENYSFRRIPLANFERCEDCNSNGI